MSRTWVSSARRWSWMSTRCWGTACCAGRYAARRSSGRRTRPARPRPTAAMPVSRVPSSGVGVRREGWLRLGCRDRSRARVSTRSARPPEPAIGIRLAGRAALALGVDEVADGGGDLLGEAAQLVGVVGAEDERAHAVLEGERGEALGPSAGRPCRNPTPAERPEDVEHPPHGLRAAPGRRRPPRRCARSSRPASAGRRSPGSAASRRRAGRSGAASAA